MLPVPTTNSALSVRTRTNTTHPPDKQSVTTTEKCQPTRMKILEPDENQLTIGKYVARDTEEVTWLSWNEFVRR